MAALSAAEIRHNCEIISNRIHLATAKAGEPAGKRGI
jgi:hypothetical protein